MLRSKRCLFIIALACLASVSAKKRTCKSEASEFQHFDRTLHFIGQGYKEVVVPKTPLTEWWHNVHNWSGRTSREEIVAMGQDALQFFYDRYGIDFRDVVSTDELYYGNVSRVITVSPTESYRFRTIVLKWRPGEEFRVTTETIGKTVNFFENPAIVHDLMYEVVPLNDGVYGGTYGGQKKPMKQIIAFGQYWIDFEKYCGLEDKAVNIYHHSNIPAEPPLYICSVYSPQWGPGQGEGAIWIDGDRSVLQYYITFPPR